METVNTTLALKQNLVDKNSGFVYILGYSEMNRTSFNGLILDLQGRWQGEQNSFYTIITALVNNQNLEFTLPPKSSRPVKVKINSSSTPKAIAIDFS